MDTLFLYFFHFYIFVSLIVNIVDFFVYIVELPIKPTTGLKFFYSNIFFPGRRRRSMGNKY